MLGRLAWRNPSCRQLLRNKPERSDNWHELIELAADDTMGDWRLPVVWWFQRHVPPTDLARLVATEIGESSRGELSERRLIIALRLAGHSAAVLPDRDAHAIFRKALALARRPINPYESNGPTLVAQSVAAVLLEQRPELDKVILNYLELQRGESPMQPDVQLPMEARLLAVALRNRTPDFGATLSNAAAKAGLGLVQLEAAARLADATLTRPSRVRALEPARAPLLAAGLAVRRALPWLLPPILAVGVTFAANVAGLSPAPTAISLGEAIALLALLVTANVFIVELSASRLPGVVSRFAAQPWQLYFSYSTILTLLALTIYRPRLPWLSAASSWAALVTLNLYVVSLLAAIFLLLRRTDVGRAAAGYVSTMLPRSRAAGRRLGHIQAHAVELGAVLETLPQVKINVDAIAGEWSRDVAARSRGFFLPSRNDMRRLLDHEEFKGGMRLRVLAGIGTIVNRGGLLASLIPSRDQTLTHRIARLATKRLRIRPCGQVDEIATGTVALTRLAFDLANAGDIGTAHIVTQNVVRLISAHTAAAREARTQVFRRQALRTHLAATKGSLRDAAPSARAEARTRDNQLVPVAPALRDSLRVAVASKLDIRADLFDVPQALIAPLLLCSGQAEAAVSILTFAVPTDTGETPAPVSERCELLRLAGVRALELHAKLVFEQVLDRLDRLSEDATGDSEAAGIASVLAAIACRFDVTLSRLAIDRALTQIDRSRKEPSILLTRKARVLWRIGAAGLACGASSIAVYGASKIFEFGAHEFVIAWTSDEEVVAGEVGRASLRGTYLGEYATDALINFGTFLNNLAPVLKPPAPTHAR